MEVIEVKLSDGRTAKIRKGKGSDLFKAQRLANDPAEVSKLLLVFLTEIDGEPLSEETLEEMPLEDVLTLMDAFGQLHPLSRMPLPVAPSSKKASDTWNSTK